MYIKVDENNVILDLISYEFDGYIYVEGDLPPTCHDGTYKFVDGVVYQDEDLKLKNINSLIQDAVDKYTLELLTGGLI